MPVSFGSIEIANAFVGDKAVSAMYLGGTQVYSNEVWEEGTGDISLRIQTPDDATSLAFAFFDSVDVESDGYVSVDWGDGKRNTYKASTSVSPTHVYAKAGEYVVKMTGSKFTSVIGHFPLSSFFNPWVREILSFKLPGDSSDVYLDSTFYDCVNLIGSVPEWDEKIKSAFFVYGGCTGLTGTIPEWGANINGNGNYYNCTGLTGSIPEWGESITTAQFTYYGCTGLTGSIPAWGEKIRNAGHTYYGCTGLESCSDALLENPMPSTITDEHTNCVAGCVDAIRQHFTEAWGGTKTS